MCKLTSNERFLSSSKYSDAIIKWDEELTGKNSVMPWIKDKIKISITLLKIKLKVVYLLAILNA